MATVIPLPTRQFREKEKNERVVGLITIFPYETYKLIILTIRAVQWYVMHAYT